MKYQSSQIYSEQNVEIATLYIGIDISMLKAKHDYIYFAKNRICTF